MLNFLFYLSVVEMLYCGGPPLLNECRGHIVIGLNVRQRLHFECTDVILDSKGNS